MTLIIVLFLAGVLLLVLEVVVPGGILGVVGGICMLVGVVAAFSEYGASGGTIATLAAVGIVSIALYLEFIFLPRSRLANKLSMSGTISGTSQPVVGIRSEVVGREVVAVTALAPTGYVELDGRRYEAFARDGHTRVGERLNVIDLDNFRLIVSKPSNSEKK
jgi:membrane-bound ClpP family serine protease